MNNIQWCIDMISANRVYEPLLGLYNENVKCIMDVYY